MWPESIRAIFRARLRALSVIAGTILVPAAIFTLAPILCLAKAQPLAVQQQAGGAANPTAVSVNNDGHLEGDDISVDNGPGNAPGGGIGVANGSVVVVHSGCARLTLNAGGELDVCGPAKFTFLDTDGSITIALDFGRVRSLLSNEIPFKIYTPFVVATPVAISGGTRDFTVGLGFSDALCVRASQGALRIEEQFTGQEMIVPRSGEFYISGGTLAPVAGPPGGCEVDIAQASNQLQAQPSAGLSAPPKVEQDASRDTSAAHPPRQRNLPTSDEPLMPDVPLQASVDGTPSLPMLATLPPANNSVELSVPASHPNPPHPAKPQQTTPPTPIQEPVYTAVMPPLRYVAGEPAPPPPPDPKTILLVREVRVQPGWTLTGTVQAGKTGTRNRGSADPPGAASAGAVSPGLPGQHRGFWHTLRKVLLFGA